VGKGRVREIATGILMNTLKIIFYFFILFTTSCAYSAEVNIEITNHLMKTLYVEAGDIQHPENRIDTQPTEIPPEFNKMKFQFSHVRNSGYFEIYLGDQPGYQICTFAYELEKGISPAECSDYQYSIQGEHIIIWNER
jgi:hypothetical protein